MTRTPTITPLNGAFVLKKIRGSVGLEARSVELIAKEECEDQR